MNAADDLELRWVHLDPGHAGVGPGSSHGALRIGGAAAARDAGEDDEVRVSSHDMSNAVTAIVGAARLLCDRWEELDEAQRRELAHMVLRRAEELRQALERSTT